MRLLLPLSLALMSCATAAQGDIPTGMPAEAWHVLNEHLVLRAQEAAKRLPLSPGVKERIGRVQDKAVLDAIEADAHRLRSFSAGTRDMSRGTLEQRTSARISLHEISNSAIPDSALQLVRDDLTKEALTRAASAPAVDLKLTQSLALAFPMHVAFRRGANVEIYNPKTPVGDDKPPGVSGPTPAMPGGFDDRIKRMKLPVWRAGFNRVSLLANVSTMPFQAVCSGIVLNNQWFLTATHCFIDRRQGAPFPTGSLSVFVPFQDGTETVAGDKGISANMLRIDIAADRRWFGETSGRQFPATEQEAAQEIGLGNDVALVRLNIPAGAIKQPFHALTIPDKPTIRPPFTLAGYGRTNATARVGNQLLEIGVRLDLVAQDSTRLYAITGGPTDNGRICDGDSGGPVFLGDLSGNEANAFQLIAIASALRPNVSSGPDICLSATQQYTRLDSMAVRNWVCSTASMAC